MSNPPANDLRVTAASQGSVRYLHHEGRQQLGRAYFRGVAFVPESKRFIAFPRPPSKEDFSLLAHLPIGQLKPDQAKPAPSGYLKETENNYPGGTGSKNGTPLLTLSQQSRKRPDDQPVKSGPAASPVSFPFPESDVRKQGYGSESGSTPCRKDLDTFIDFLESLILKDDGNRIDENFRERLVKVEMSKLPEKYKVLSRYFTDYPYMTAPTRDEVEAVRALADNAITGVVEHALVLKNFGRALSVTKPSG